LIWCPASNLSLFGKSADVMDLVGSGHVALGTDSRLSGYRDLLEEIRVAGHSGGFDDATLELLVTRASARILRLADRGALRVGLRADLLVLPADIQLSKSSRADVRLVVVNGEARFGDADCARACSPDTGWTAIRVDGTRKVLIQHIATRLSQSNAAENGLELLDSIEQAA
jgi:hypothetical protein